MAPRRGPLSAGSGVGLPGFTSRFSQLQDVTLALPESQFPHLKKGGANLLPRVLGFSEACRWLDTVPGTHTRVKTHCNCGY